MGAALQLAEFKATERGDRMNGETRDQIRMLTLHLELTLLEAKRAHELLEKSFEMLAAYFPEMSDDVQLLLMRGVDEFAQDAVRRRDLCDTTLDEFKRQRGRNDP